MVCHKVGSAAVQARRPSRFSYSREGKEQQKTRAHHPDGPAERKCGVTHRS